MAALQLAKPENKDAPLKTTKTFRVVLAVLWGLFLALYIAGKVHFFTRYDPLGVEPEPNLTVPPVGTGSPMTQAVVCRTLSVEATYPMSAKSTAPAAKTTFILDGAGRRYLIPQEKEQAFDAWTAAVEKQELEEYVKNGGESFERYKLTENHVQNFALLKTFYGSSAN